MDDAYGLLTHPVPVVAADEPASDPALKVILDFARAVLNAQMGAAWEAVCPSPAAGPKRYPVNGVFGWDPEPPGHTFNDKAVPALFAWRRGGPGPYDLASDWRVSNDTISLLWVIASTQQDRQSKRSPAINGMAKMLDRAIANNRSPEYAKAGDPDPLAASYAAAPTAVKLAAATSTSTQTFTAIDFDGGTDVSALSPRRSASVSLAGPASAFFAGSFITITGKNALGLVSSATIEIPSVISGAGTTPAGEDPAGSGPDVAVTLSTGVEFASITSVAVDPQADGLGAISVGLGARVGLGSSLTAALGAYQDLTPLRAATPRPVTIRMADRGDPMTYFGVEWQFTLDERLNLDVDEYDQLGDPFGLDLSIAREDGSVIEQALL